MHFLAKTLILLAVDITITSSKVAAQHTAVLFGATGAVGSEVLKSLLDDSAFEEVVLIVRNSSPKLDTILSDKSQEDSTKNVTTLNFPNIGDGLKTYDKIEKADACFVAVGLGDINTATLEYWLSVEVDLIGTIAGFCDKINVQSITLLSAVDVDYESALPFSQQELLSENQKPLGWMRSISLYNRVKGLEENAVISAAENIAHIRLFQPSSIVTEETRYGWVDRIFFFLHGWLDEVIPVKYHSVDVRLLGMAMVADAKEVLSNGKTHSLSPPSEELNIAKLMYADFLNVAGESFKEKYGLQNDEL